jgi:hypothetical protein
MPASLFLKAGGATQLLILPEEIKHSSAPSAPSAPLIYVCFSNIQVLTCAISADWRTESRGSGSSVSSDEVCGVAGAFSVDGLDDDIEPSSKSCLGLLLGQGSAFTLPIRSSLTVGIVLDDYFIAIKDIAELNVSRLPAARTLLQLLRAAAPNERVRPSNDPTTLIVVEHISNGMMHALAIPARCLVYAGSKQRKCESLCIYGTTR